MIVDVAAFTGAWPSHPVHGRLDDVVAGLYGLALMALVRILFPEAPWGLGS